MASSITAATLRAVDSGQRAAAGSMANFTFPYAPNRVGPQGLESGPLRFARHLLCTTHHATLPHCHNAVATCRLAAQPPATPSGSDDPIGLTLPFCCNSCLLGMQLYDVGKEPHETPLYVHSISFLTLHLRLSALYTTRRSASPPALETIVRLHLDGCHCSANGPTSGRVLSHVAEKNLNFPYAYIGRTGQFGL